MTYVDSTLIAGEDVVYRTRRHWISLLLPVAVGTLLFFFSLLSFLGANDSNGTGTFGFIFLVLAVIALGVGYLRWKSIEAAVTTKRIIIKKGVLTQDSLEMSLAKVESIAVSQGLIGRMLDYGTIFICGTGGTEEPFTGIAHPMEFRHQIQQQMDRLQPAIAATGRS